MPVQESPTVKASKPVAAQPATAGAAPKSASTARKRLPYPTAVTNRIIWIYTIPLVSIHLLALLAFVPWLFSWSGVVLLVVGTYFFGGIGIDLCYHRLLTHRSLEVPRWLERFFVTVAVCCFEDAPASWVATHRLHHNESDEVEDPHSPLVHFFWGHFSWLLWENRAVRNFSAYDKFARDILRDPFYMRLQRTALQFWIYLGHAALYMAGGFATGWIVAGSVGAGVQLALSWLVWGVLLRTVCVWHISWTVNSLSHVFGYRNYDTKDNSRNNWLVAFLTSGEGWHNNHHHDPSSASNAHKWWELDLIYMVIKGLELVGLARNVIPPRHLRRAAA